MGAAALEHSYAYPFASEIQDVSGRPTLRLATFGGLAKNPQFFTGKLINPRRTSDMLLALSLISRTRFFMPRNILLAADPVVTAATERLRFEAFSVCCGVYARLDMHPSALDGEWLSHGTTNVDFNPPMRAALARVLASEDVRMKIGDQHVTLEQQGHCVVEKKVKLPVRWLKGFVEVQAYQARMKLLYEIPSAEARRFLSTLPRQLTFGPPSYVSVSGRSLRLSQRESPNSVVVGGPARLKILEELARHAKTLRIYGGPDGVSAWELFSDDLRFHIVLSPEIQRGFSGEGQALAQLASGNSEELVAQVRAALNWQTKINPHALSQTLNVPGDRILQSLSILGTRGLVGYDLGESAFFHRVMPFDMELVDELQPRLLDAKQLVAEKAVRIISKGSEKLEAYVKGTDCEHRVRTVDGSMRCTCPWFSRNQGARGPCKHILAVQLVTEDEE